jgi:hypothetical protein
MIISEEVSKQLNEAKAQLKGYARRHFMAETVKTLCNGSPSQAERELGWNRATLQKALGEQAGGYCAVEQSHRRGRKPSEAHLPGLLDDLREIAEQCSQTEPTFRTTQWYTRLTAKEARHQLVVQKGYAAECLPSEETIRQKRNQLGYKLKRVKKANQ